MPKLFFPMQPGGAACQDPTVAWTLGVRERHRAELGKTPRSLGRCPLGEEQFCARRPCSGLKKMEPGPPPPPQQRVYPVMRTWTSWSRQGSLSIPVSLV